MRQYRIKVDTHPFYRSVIYTPQFKLFNLFWVNLVGTFGGRVSSWAPQLAWAQGCIEIDIEERKKTKQKPTYIKYPNE